MGGVTDALNAAKECLAHVCTGNALRCIDGNGCECEMAGNAPTDPAIALHKLVAALSAQPRPVEMSNDGNNEADFIAHHDAACPACGGSGHKADFNPGPTHAAVIEFRRFLNAQKPVDGKITVKQARHILSAWPQSASSPVPEVHSYDPTERRESVTIRWEDGACLSYVLDRTRYTNNLPASAPVGVEAIHPDFAQLNTIDELANAVVKNTTSDKYDSALLADVRDCLLRAQQLAAVDGADKRDAGRYQFLRDNNGVRNHHGVEVYIDGEAHAPGHLDAQVDAALAQPQGASHE